MYYYSMVKKSNADCLCIICCENKVYDDGFQWEFTNLKWYACADARKKIYAVSGNIELDVRMYNDDDVNNCYADLKSITKEYAENILYNDIIPNIKPSRWQIMEMFKFE